MNREELIKKIVELRDQYRNTADTHRSMGHEVERHMALEVSLDLENLLRRSDYGI